MSFASLTMAQGQESEPDHSCLDELPRIIAEINSTVTRVSFCDDFAEGVIIAFDNIYSRSDLGAMIMRCKSLDLLDDASVKRMWMNYTRRGWRKGEPFDGKTEKETPYLMKRSFEMLIEAGVKTQDEITSDLPYPLDDLEEIAGLPVGSLGSTTRVRAEPKLKNSVTSSDNVVTLFNRGES